MFFFSDTHVTHRLTGCVSGIAAVTATCLLACFGPATYSQQPEAGYVLYRIATGTTMGERNQGAKILYADRDGGSASVEMKVTDNCKETIRFAWKFDRDITFLKAGESFKVEATVETNECPGTISNPAISVRGLGSGGFKPALRQKLSTEDRERFTLNKGMLEDSTNPRDVYGKNQDNVSPVGRGVFGFKSPFEGPQPVSWFTVNLGAESRKPDGRLNDRFFEVQIVYLYLGIPSSTPPASVTVTTDNPQPGQNATATWTPSSGGMRPPGQGASEPCLDAAVQRCMDEWGALATRLRNERSPELGPWRVSPYGHWINRVVVATAPPDGWFEKYHGSRYCYIWEVGISEHENPVYRGDLPPLREYVRDCVNAATGATIDIGAGGRPGEDGRPGSGVGAGSGGRPGTGLDYSGTTLAPAGGRLGDINLIITYPTDLLQLVEAPDASLPSSTLFELNTEPAGIIRIGLADQQGIVGDMPLCRLDFRLTGPPGEVAPLIGQVTSANRTDNRAVRFGIINGQIRILDDALPGDFNTDGVINSLDALAALRMSIGKLPEEFIMDVDSDGRVTARDARLLLGLAAGNDPSPADLVPSRMSIPTQALTPDISGPVIIIGSGSRKFGEVVTVPVMLHYE